MSKVIGLTKMTYKDLLQRNERRRGFAKRLAVSLACAQALLAIYVDPWMIMFALYNFWLTRFPKDVWSFRRRSDAAAVMVAAFVGIITAIFTLPYFLLVYAGWFATWKIYNFVTNVIANDCYWCHKGKPKDENLHCPECAHLSKAKTISPIQKHWEVQHNGDKIIFNTICYRHSRLPKA